MTSTRDVVGALSLVTATTIQRSASSQHQHSSALKDEHVLYSSLSNHLTSAWSLLPLNLHVVD